MLAIENALLSTTGAELECCWKCQAQFIEKNNDALHTSLAVLITESKNPLVKKIFEGDASIQQVGKLTFISIGSKFRSQLGVLMEKLGSTVYVQHYNNSR